MKARGVSQGVKRQILKHGDTEKNSEWHREIQSRPQINTEVRQIRFLRIKTLRNRKSIIIAPSI